MTNIISVPVYTQIEEGSRSTKASRSGVLNQGAVTDAVVVATR